MEENKNSAYDKSSLGDLEKMRPKQNVDKVCEKRREIYQGFDKSDLVVLQSCYLCNSAEIGHIFNKEGFSYFQCKECEFLFQNPRLRKKEYYRIYCKSEFSEIYHEQIHFRNYQHRKEKNFKNKITYLPLLKKRECGSLLDVGAADGAFLDVIKEVNPAWNCIGIEPSEHAVEYVQNLGINIFQGYFEDYNEAPSTFDYITMWGVLPYLYDLNIVIPKCYELLKTGGRLIISSPNMKGFESMILGKHHTHIGADSLHYFDTENIQVLLRKFGFQNIVVETPGKYDIEFVQQTCNNNPGILKTIDSFNRKLIFNDNERIKNNFQSFLADNKLSNHMIIVAVK